MIAPIFIPLENLFMRWLDSIPLHMLIMATIMLGLAPFVPEPHLFEKVKMLIDGSLVKPIDIFDLLMHGAPAILLTFKLFRESTKAKQII